MNREAKFGLLFRHWLKQNPMLSGAFELKQTTTNSISFSCVEDHQLDYLMAIKGPRGVLIRVQGTNGEPDYNYYRNAYAWVVIRYPHAFHIIDVEAFIIEKKRSKRKSLTSGRAKEIAWASVPLKTIK